MFKYSSEFFTDRSKAVLLLWILFCYLCFTVVFIILSCLFLAALWSPAGKGLTSWLSCLWFFLIFLSHSDMVSRVSCGTWFYQFLIFFFFFTFTVLLASDDFCHLLITFANSLDQDIGRYWSNPFDTLIKFQKELFEKKKSADDNKSMKYYPACKEGK